MQGPGGPVPGPGVVERPGLPLAEAVAAEEDHHMAVGVVNHGRVGTSRWAQGRQRLLPRGAVVGPGIGGRWRAGAEIPAEENELAAGGIAAQAGQAERAWPAAVWWARRPGVAIEGIDVGVVAFSAVAKPLDQVGAV